MKRINKTEKPRGVAGGAGISWKREFSRSWPLYMFVLPAVILAVIFCYIPMAGLIMAFQNYKPWLGIFGSEFAGLDNFRQIFEFRESYQAIINTLIIAVSKIILGLIVPVIMALLLNEVKQLGLKKSIQTLVYLPHFLSWVTVAGMLRDILGLDGIVNAFLQKIGFFSGRSGAVPPDCRTVGSLERVWLRDDSISGSDFQY